MARAAANDAGPRWSAPQQDGPVLLGLSGGLDSTVLLHLLAGEASMRARGLRAVHVHHGLHTDADDWAAHCAGACAALGVPLIVHRVEVRAQGDGPEAAARRARREAFAGELCPNEALALAHHRDDQAETFLLRALRASGPDGLAAMRAWSAFASGWLWRPLLAVPRAELLAYARRNGLSWIEDPSNGDDAFDRNFLRHRVLPLLRERWPHVDAAFARSAALQADAARLLDAGDAAALAEATQDDASTLPVASLRTLDGARRARVLRRWIAALDLPPLPANGVDMIEHSLLHARTDGDATFAWAGTQILRWRDTLHAEVQHASLASDWSARWSGDAPLPLPHDGALRLEACPGSATNSTGGVADSSCAPPWRVHARQGGERIVLPARAHSHALKHVLQQRDVPPWDRRHLPLLFSNDGALLAAGDAIVSAAFDAWLRARGLRLRWIRPGGRAACAQDEAAAGPVQ